MTDAFVMSVREYEDGKFISEPGISRFLFVPRGAKGISPKHAIAPDEWFRRLREASVWRDDGQHKRGDILFFVHGYNNSQDEVLRRHRRLATDLAVVGFKGVVASFDWPSGDQALNYLEDRHDAKKTAMQLVTDGVKVLSDQQRPDCWINVHLMGHSTGAFVIREAFHDADTTNLSNSGWMVSQVVLIGADVSSRSMSADDRISASLYAHCTRLTNYTNARDSVLKLSNAKRLGAEPRIGRVGLPKEAPKKAVDVDCSAYFERLDADEALKKRDQAEEIGTFCHSWHIGNRVFARDLFETLIYYIRKSSSGAPNLMRPRGVVA